LPWLQTSRYRTEDTAADIPVRVGSLLDEMQLDYYSYVILRPPSDLKFDCAETFSTNYPTEWLNRYLSNRYLDLDPVAVFAPLPQGPATGVQRSARISDPQRSVDPGSQPQGRDRDFQSGGQEQGTADGSYGRRAGTNHVTGL